MGKKLIKCPFCDRKYLESSALFIHMDKIHHDELHSLTPKQVEFNYRNKYELTRGNGKSVVSGKPTPWNETTGRYLRFLPEEKEEYRKYFLANMRRAGKADIMKDMEHQKQMLAARHISGKYIWSDGSEKTYTGTYERKFLEYLDTILHFPSADVYAPALQLFPYKAPDSGELKYHIPDFYITSLNLIINIKSSTNKFYRLRDIETERAQDAAIRSSDFNYIKLYDNDFEKLVSGIEKIKYNLNNDIRQRVIIEATINLNNESEIINTLLE